MHEGVCNHLSVKTPSLYRQDPIVLLIPYGMYWSEVTPQCLVGGYLINVYNIQMDVQNFTQYSSVPLQRSVSHNE